MCFWSGLTWRRNIAEKCATSIIRARCPEYF
jgi:hypothetical protein